MGLGGHVDLDRGRRNRRRRRARLRWRGHAFERPRRSCRGLRRDRSFGRGRALDTCRPLGQRRASPFPPDAGVSRRAVMTASAHRPGAAARGRRWKVVLMSGPESIGQVPVRGSYPGPPRPSRRRPGAPVAPRSGRRARSLRTRRCPRCGRRIGPAGRCPARC